MASISTNLAQFVSGLTYDQIPASVIDKAKLHILDTLGIGLASSKHDFGQSVYRAVRALGSGGKCTVIGFPDQMPAASALLVNGTLIHGLDYDDTHIDGIVHSGVTVVPTALAAGEEVGADGKTVLAAMVAGYEVLTRLGMAVQGRLHPRGFHPTGVFGSLSSTLIAGRLYGLPVETMASAMGLTGTMASGLLEIGESWLKRINPGWASHSGIVGALLAKEGFIGPDTILEGPSGIYASHLYGETYQLETLTEGLGVNWETLNIGFKPYPCCHFLHASIDCSKLIRQSPEFDPDQIDEIVCKVSEPLMMMTEHESYFHPKTEYAAQFSFAFVVATMLAEGKLDLGSFRLEKLSDPILNRLINKTRFEVDLESDHPKNFPGDVTVKTKQGRTFKQRQTFNRGAKDHPLSKEEVVRKFRENLSGVIADEASQDLIDMVERFEKITNVGKFMKLLADK